MVADFRFSHPVEPQQPVDLLDRCDWALPIGYRTRVHNGRLIDRDGNVVEQP